MPKRYYPDYEEFKQLAVRGNLVPVYRQLFADALTPVSAFQKISDTGKAFLLESAAGGEKISRYSLLSADPFLEFTASGNRIEIKRRGREMELVYTHDPLCILRDEVKSFTPVQVDGLPQFFCCGVGYIGYDAIRYYESLPNTPKDDLLLPDIQVMFCDTMIIFDHVTKTMKVVCTAKIDGDRLENVYDAAVAKIDRIIEKLRTPVMPLSDDITTEKETNIAFSSNFERADFLKAVDRCKEYIRAGDIFQVVISQRFKTQTHADPFSIYRVLRVINPSPYMFYMKMDDLKLIGSSPEVMVKVEGKKITVRPIAGTRKRGKDDAEDTHFAQDLIADPKERAEHIMLLDLGRNDVGRVSRYGSVHIDEKMVIEKYSHVMHITSSVCGELEEGKNAFDSLKACLPAGTLSGAPKIRAMQIIDEIEPAKRGPYGGAVGYFDFFGNMNTCITIRTILLKGNDAYIQAGAGIVADSVPEREYEETVNKAKGLLRAIEIAEKITQERDEVLAGSIKES
ncbi:MAG: anthranilate synthase component I [Candidatus Brocadia sp.]|uniref:Anthranilate synthase component 1 n=1 Tax=Candidatus Brocadia fulgida TaxID=380242 RepID=A0A0M2UYC7_9BACT|nr:MAG: anthranilate synthase component I [Candidatus Brocadia fulgida]MCC6325374.1 anthranilate synthase component I [Candidatus Brocadia sp.]MCE7911151.1 anthranilate synthase component I [Candidatus Brocadia sp. AMX3]MBV6518933.1 Anthranilate synthase component 1 [Candidatus Brocadia fulgida]MDG5996564.1 anthranilate synthase component I [Candidatus Brocadia sp.]